MKFVPAQSPAPLIEMNTTPLIDILLVLLIMLIITIPPPTHAVKFDLSSAPTPPLPIDAKSNLLTVSADGTVRWNGTPVDRAELRQELAASRQMASSPELHIQPDPKARHGDVDDVLVAVKREQIRRFGFVGNERYRAMF
jgi:biopolymer transport protein ExbD